jgi:hypothetical protein
MFVNMPFDSFNAILAVGSCQGDIMGLDCAASQILLQVKVEQHVQVVRQKISHNLHQVQYCRTSILCENLPNKNRGSIVKNKLFKCDNIKVVHLMIIF